MPLVSLRPSGGRRNSTGLLLASAFALIGAGVVLFVFISGKPRQSGPAIPGDRIKVGQLPANVGDATDIAAVGGTKEARFQVADKNDPSRIAMELVFAKLDPLGAGVYQAAEPRAWAYMKDGRTVFVRADSGRIRRSPTATAPESGEFTGNGLLLVFPARAPGDTRAIDPLNDTPGMIGHFTTASFDTVLLEISSQDDWTVESEALWATGKGFVVRANQVLERLEFAKINSGGQIRTHVHDRTAAANKDTTFMGPPAPPATSITAAQSGEGAGPGGKHAPGMGLTAGMFMGPPLPSPVQKEDLYLAEFRDGVTLVQTGRKLSADLLSVWTRFLDNKLPDGALGWEEAEASSEPQRSTETVSVYAPPTMPLRAQLAALSLTQVKGTRTLFEKSDTDIILSWTGGMVARPLSSDNPPPELANANHVHARFTAERPGGESRVVLTDIDTGAVGVCSTLDYAATNRQLTLAKGANVDRVDFAAPGAGRFVVPNVTINLATGAGRVNGAGVMLYLPDDEHKDMVTVNPEHPRPADPDAPLPEALNRQISWGERAEFKFRAKEQKITDALKSAVFVGDVVARDRASWLSGDQVAAEFIERPEKKSSLSRLKVSGHALGIGRSNKPVADEAMPSQDPYIAAGELDVRFAPSTINRKEEDAQSVLATGDVRIGDKRGQIAAERLEAQLIRKSKSDYEAGDVKARGKVQLELTSAGGGGAVLATSDEFHADGQKRWADLIGDKVRITKGSSVIAGKQMHLEELDGRLEVFGAGSMRHLQLAENASDAAMVLPEGILDAPESAALPPGLTVMRATWSRSMSFNDRTGRIECHGDATVTSTTLEGGQVARSERLLLNITPGGDSGAGAATAQPATPAGGSAVTLGSLNGGGGDKRLDGRKLLRAESLGSILETDGGQPASVKSWKFAATPGPDGKREYDQVLYIEGPRIIADELSGNMTIPDAGRGVTFDRGKSNGAGTSGSTLGGQSSGRSQFTWAGVMEFNRLTGVLKMQKDVELRHLPLDSNELVRMVCNDLTATFNMNSGKGAELLTADANGGVYAESGPRHLTADQFTYDALTSAAIARSLSDSPVTMQDDRQPAPLLAKALRWETRTDRVEITEPMPVTGGMVK